MTRLFTNFSTAWVNGNEPAPDAAELDACNAARALDEEEDREDAKVPPPSAPTKERAAAVAAPCLPPEGIPMAMKEKERFVPTTATMATPDMFSPLPPLPSQPSAPLITAMLQHIGGQTLVRPPLPPRRPQKPIDQVTWQADVLTLLSKCVPDYDVPDIEEIERLPSMRVPFPMDALVERFVTWKNGDGSLAEAMCDVERVVRIHAQVRLRSPSHIPHSS